jgi:hypothetical protein
MDLPKSIKENLGKECPNPWFNWNPKDAQLFSIFHIMTGRKIMADRISPKYGSLFLNQNLYFGEKIRNKNTEKGIKTPLYLESIAKPVVMPSKYQYFLLFVSIMIINIRSDRSQKRASGESGTAITDPKKENTGRTFNNNTPTKAVLSL